VHETGWTRSEGRDRGEFEKSEAAICGFRTEVRAIEDGLFRAAAASTIRRSLAFELAQQSNPALRAVRRPKCRRAQEPGYGIVSVSLKPIGGTPGDATAEQMDVSPTLPSATAMTSSASAMSRTSSCRMCAGRHPAVYANCAAPVWRRPISACLRHHRLPGHGLLRARHGALDPGRAGILEALRELKLEREIGPLKIKISGCINACGHHHVGHIGILGLDKAGKENYQITLGGSFSSEEVVDAIETLVDTYLGLRSGKDETFLDAYRRVGEAPFKEALYGVA
jgi:sulfite reductase (NADPH) hemoprotein beta-component